MDSSSSTLSAQPFSGCFHGKRNDLKTSRDPPFLPWAPLLARCQRKDGLKQGWNHQMGVLSWFVVVDVCWWIVWPSLAKPRIHENVLKFKLSCARCYSWDALRYVEIVQSIPDHCIMKCHFERCLLSALSSKKLLQSFKIALSSNHSKSPKGFWLTEM